MLRAATPLLGFLTDWHGWEWHGWEALVAIGTLTLAAATGYLAVKTRYVARETRDLARETARTADADQRALQASIAPILVGYAYASVSRRPERMWIVVRSVGTGPAVLTTPRPLLQLDGSGRFQGAVEQLVVPPGEDLQLEFDVFPQANRAIVEIAYTDVAGAQLRRTRILYLDEPGMGWAPRGFALYEGPDRVMPTLINGLWLEEEQVPA